MAHAETVVGSIQLPGRETLPRGERQAALIVSAAAHSLKDCPDCLPSQRTTAPTARRNCHRHRLSCTQCMDVSSIGGGFIRVDEWMSRGRGERQRHRSQRLSAYICCRALTRGSHPTHTHTHTHTHTVIYRQNKNQNTQITRLASIVCKCGIHCDTCHNNPNPNPNYNYFSVSRNFIVYHIVTENYLPVNKCMCAELNWKKKHLFCHIAGWERSSMMHN